MTVKVDDLPLIQLGKAYERLQDARRELARTYNAFFSGAPVKHIVADAEKRWLDARADYNSQRERLTDHKIGA